MAPVDPLGEGVPVARCQSCDAVHTEPAGDLPERCEVCGGPLTRFDLYQPRGFRTDYRPRDFDDQVERGPSSGSPQLAWQAGESDRLYEVRGLVVASRPECLLPPASEALAVGGRGPGLAALWSFAQLLGIAGAAELDVDPRELEIGLQPTRLRSGAGAAGVTRRIFLADRLENGAGYCRLLGEPARLERVLDRIVDEIGERLRQDGHAGTCDSSCPDCLRSYDNRRLHPLLDWRLGLDLAELAAARPLEERRWLDDAPAIGSALAAAFGLRLETIADLPALRDDGRPKAAVLCHPMWSAEQRRRRVDGAASANGAPEIRCFDLYTAKSFPDEIAVWLDAD